MSEQPKSTSSNEMLGGLGKNFHGAVAGHIARHEEGRGSVERRKRFQEFSERLAPIATEYTGDEKHTLMRHVETLETGTRISAYLDTSRANEEANRSSISSVVTWMLDPAKRIAGSYLAEGPVSANREAFNVPGGQFTLPDERVDKLTRDGLFVMASLRTDYEDGQDGTNDDVLVGVIIDPETIIVPASEPNGQEPYFSMIGPSDERFSAIMDMAYHVVSGEGEQQERPVAAAA